MRTRMWLCFSKIRETRALATNKVDDNSFVRPFYEFYNLGLFRRIFPVSSLLDRHPGLLDMVMTLLPEEKD